MSPGRQPEGPARPLRGGLVGEWLQFLWGRRSWWLLPLLIGLVPLGLLLASLLLPGQAFLPDGAAREYEQARTAMARGQREQGRKHLEEALRIRPDYPEANSELGQILVAEGRDLAMAERYLRIALKGRGDHAPSLCALGVLRRLGGATEEAVGLFEAALRSDPKYVESYRYLGMIWEDRRDLSRAARYYRQGLTVQPDHPLIPALLGSVLLRQHDLAGAREQFEMAVRAAPRSYKAREGLAQVLKELGDEPGYRRQVEILQRISQGQ